MKSRHMGDRPPSRSTYTASSSRVSAPAWRAELRRATVSRSTDDGDVVGPDGLEVVCGRSHERTFGPLLRSSKRANLIS